ncbi:MAG TPA: Uma2 family endonuclease [Candidatus Baltobacteraceae bacterium]|jgi:Uma2 family endonuclease|nr:Uma2 family endonuclease [Candidatus Baltobacteraceae bacterium]
MALPDHRVTLAEYLKLQKKSEVPLEYIDGFVVAEFPTDNRAEISNNLTMRLAPIADSKGCLFRSGNGKVIAPDEKTHMVPDIVVSCDRRDITYREDNAFKRHESTILYPWLVIEILSPSTQKKDKERGFKFLAYESIKELTHYVLIRSQKREMDVYERLGNGRLATPGAVDRLSFPHFGNFEMSIDEVYKNTIMKNRNLKVVYGPRF